MFKTLLPLALCLVFLNSCSSLSKGSSSFRSAFKSLQKNEFKLAEKDFQKACSSGASGACALIGKDLDVKLERLALIQGLGSNTQAEIRVLREGRKPHHYLVFPSYSLSSNQSLQKSKVISPISQPVGQTGWSMDQLLVQGLDRGLSYRLLILSEEGQLLDQRTFTVSHLSRPDIKIAVASCSDDRVHLEQKQMWTELASHQPDLLFLIGDNVYADSSLEYKLPAPPNILWTRNLETRNSLELFRLEKLIPVIALWDDHDFGQNDGDKTYPYIAESKKVFETFFPLLEVEGLLNRGPGVSSHLILNEQNFFFLDGRSFRTPNDQGGAEESHWGEEQEKWLLARAESFKQPTWLVSGDQFWGGYHPFESYEKNHPESFKKMVSVWKSWPFPVAFLSGDRHLTEIIELKNQELPYRTYEFTSSGIHAKVFPDAYTRHENPKKLVGVAGELNYMMISSTKFRNQLRIRAESFGPGKKRHFSKDLKISR